MNTFNVGNRVIRTQSHHVLVVGCVYVVDDVSEHYIGLNGHGTQYDPKCFKLCPDMERDEVENAMNVFEKYGIYRTSSNRYRSRSLMGCELNRDKDVFLNTAFPKKNKELEALKEKAKELQASIEALEKSL